MKNRLHIDLFVDDVESEVARLIELGATVAAAPENSRYAQRNVVLLDLEGNEFCVVERKLS